MNCAKLGMMACAERKLIKNKMGPSRSPDLCYNTFLPDTGQGNWIIMQKKLGTGC